MNSSSPTTDQIDTMSDTSDTTHTVTLIASIVVCSFVIIGLIIAIVYYCKQCKKVDDQYMARESENVRDKGLEMTQYELDMEMMRRNFEREQQQKAQDEMVDSVDSEMGFSNQSKPIAFTQANPIVIPQPIQSSDHIEKRTDTDGTSTTTNTTHRKLSLRCPCGSGTVESMICEMCGQLYVKCLDCHQRQAISRCNCHGTKLDGRIGTYSCKLLNKAAEDDHVHEPEDPKMRLERWLSLDRRLQKQIKDALNVSAFPLKTPTSKKTNCQHDKTVATDVTEQSRYESYVQRRGLRAEKENNRLDCGPLKTQQSLQQYPPSYSEIQDVHPLVSEQNEQIESLHKQLDAALKLNGQTQLYEELIILGGCGDMLHNKKSDDGSKDANTKPTSKSKSLPNIKEHSISDVEARQEESHKSSEAGSARAVARMLNALESPPAELTFDSHQSAELVIRHNVRPPAPHDYTSFLRKSKRNTFERINAVLDEMQDIPEVIGLTVNDIRGERQTRETRRHILDNFLEDCARRNSSY